MSSPGFRQLHPSTRIPGVVRGTGSRHARLAPRGRGAWATTPFHAWFVRNPQVCLGVCRSRCLSHACIANSSDLMCEDLRYHLKCSIVMPRNCPVVSALSQSCKAQAARRIQICTTTREALTIDTDGSRLKDRSGPSQSIVSQAEPHNPACHERRI